MSKENGQNLSAGKLLVVDDDSNLIELVAMKLKGANYEVAAALKEEDASKPPPTGSLTFVLWTSSSLAETEFL